MKERSRVSATMPTTIALHEIVPGLSRAMDLMCPQVVSHHARTAYFADRLSKAAGLSARDRYEVVVAALLHDVGAFSRRERLDLLQFELQDAGRHCVAGWRLLEMCEPLKGAARLIRNHHARWAGGREPERGCHIIHLADRVEILTPHKGDVLLKVRGIVRRLRGEAGKLFDPELVACFSELAADEEFWMDVARFRPGKVLQGLAHGARLSINHAGLDQLARVFSFLIDFKSPFTATHTSGVAAVAARLGETAGLDKDTTARLRTAGYLHDIGKLAVPSEILEKPERLTPREFDIMKKHPSLTRRILEATGGLADLAGWAADHHERMDGRGYPFRVTGEGLPLPSRVMAVSDVFTALSEDRPYRKGMGKALTLGTLEEMTRDGHLDGHLTALIRRHYPDLDGVRKTAQREAARTYRTFARSLERIN